MAQKTGLPIPKADVNVKSGSKCTEMQIVAGMRETPLTILKLVITGKIAPRLHKFASCKQPQNHQEEPSTSSVLVLLPVVLVCSEIALLEKLFPLASRLF